MSETFENEQTRENVEGITILLDGMLREVIDVILQRIPRYSSSVDVVQDALVKGLDLIRKEIWDLTNTRLADQYSRWASYASAPEQAEEKARYVRLERTYRANAAEEQDRVTAQKQVIDQAVSDRDQAAQTAMSQIEAITSSDGLNDSWWDDWGSKVVSWIADIAEVVAAIAGILALVLCWVPVVGQALLAIAAIAGVVAAVANIALAATGEKSWTEAIISIVFAALGCVGLGGLRGVLGAVKGGAMLAKGGLPAFAAVFKTGATSIKAFATTMRSVGVGTMALNGIKTIAARAIVQLSPRARALTGKTIFGWRINDPVKQKALQYTIEHLRAIPGYHDVIAHGSPTSVLGNHGEELTAKQLADSIRTQGWWNGQEAIRLASCRTGAGPFAQELANELGVPVMAPIPEIYVNSKGTRILDYASQSRIHPLTAEMVVRHPQWQG